MNTDILHREIQHFIDSNIGVDVNRLALSKNPFPELDWKEILNQVAAKSKAKDKLPTWFNTENIIFPGKISIEQTSSETTARYKAGLISGNTLIDLTGGFGVDDYYFSRQLKSVWHCEINRDLSEIAEHNFRRLGVGNIECHWGDSTEILKKNGEKWDWIYIDPSRRSDAKGKVFMLGDCLPNVPQNLDLYFSHSDNILIKTAPLLDISAGLSELSNVKAIHIVAVNNEVKELLWILEKDYTGGISIRTIDFGKEKTNAFGFALGGNSAARLDMPGKFLYEANAAIMKSGGFDAVSSQLDVAKLHQHSHLYTSGEKKAGFPGRSFEILEILPYNKTAMKGLSGKKANVTTRNFQDSVEAIRKKWKIADGGDVFCFFTTNPDNEKIVLICSKI